MATDRDIIPGWTRSELIAEVLTAPSRFLVGLPDTEVHDRPGWRQLVTPSLTRGGLNDVSLAVLAPDEVEAAIDGVLATYAGIGFRWTVGPDSAPPELGARLAARGLVASEVRVMARAIGPADPTDPAVEPVTREGAALDDFTAVMAQGWGADAAVIHRLHQAMIVHPSGRHRLFLARADGRPAGAAAYLAASERSAYLMGAVVLPGYRGRGLYRALVAARLGDAHGRGLTLATSQANATTSAPILARMGFVEVLRMASYARS